MFEDNFVEDRWRMEKTLVNKIFFIPLLVMGFVSNMNSSFIQKDNLDSIFVNWNKATFASLNRQLQSSDTTKMKSYANRLLTINGYWGIEGIEDINVNSLRYKFLQIVFSRDDAKEKDFYIIESNESGSTVRIRNFILYTDSMHNTQIEFYLYVNNEWKKQGTCRINKIDIENDLKKYIAPFGKGFNYDDIIITKFRSSIIDQSEYYLFGTLSSISKINTILNCSVRPGSSP
ncbi:MAG: hypothetical protein E6H07_12130 [Bacteroidetes bacterium]|nr:MAG: hypothetical protein E6H07_12130 [Bacteroidota bacterium]